MSFPVSTLGARGRGSLCGAPTTTWACLHTQVSSWQSTRHITLTAVLQWQYKTEILVFILIIRFAPNIRLLDLIRPNILLNELSGHQYLAASGYLIS